MHEKAKFVCFIHMQPQKVKFKFVQINMKHVLYKLVEYKKCNLLLLILYMSVISYFLRDLLLIKLYTPFAYTDYDIIIYIQL